MTNTPASEPTEGQTVRSGPEDATTDHESQIHDPTPTRWHMEVGSCVNGPCVTATTEPDGEYVEYEDHRAEAERIRDDAVREETERCAEEVEKDLSHNPTRVRKYAAAIRATKGEG